jgi:hypothetical protein
LASINLGARLGAAIHRKYFMRWLPTFHLRALAVSSFCLIIPLGLFLVELSLKRSPQSLRPRQDLHSIVSRKALSPARRSPDASLRFSPDGKYLLFQDPSGVIVMSKDPLNIVLRVSTEDIYPAQFSLDSPNITIVSRALNFARWRLPDGQKTDHGSLPIEDGCLDGQLSPNGEISASLAVNFELALYEVGLRDELTRDAKLQAQWNKENPGDTDYFLQILNARDGTVAGGIVVRTGKSSFHLENQ